jgi:hypothetical protein
MQIAYKGLRMYVIVPCDFIEGKFCEVNGHYFFPACLLKSIVT